MAMPPGSGRGRALGIAEEARSREWRTIPELVLAFSPRNACQVCRRAHAATLGARRMPLERALDVPGLIMASQAAPRDPYPRDELDLLAPRSTALRRWLPAVPCWRRLEPSRAASCALVQRAGGRAGLDGPAAVSANWRRDARRDSPRRASRPPGDANARRSPPSGSATSPDNPNGSPRQLSAERAHI
jgi:hypothetical protein